MLNYVAQGKYPAMIEGVLNYYPVWWEGGNEDLLGISNFGLEHFPQLTLWLPADKEIASIRQLNRKGEWKQADYILAAHPYQGQRVTLQTTSVPGPLSYETFLFTYET
ncbi:hypothetical protein D3C73_456630 [compost metagenome]